MAATNINRVVLTGNLTRDPELRTTGGGTSVCSLRLATNTRRKDGASGEWVDKPNYFDVSVFGRSGESAAKYLAKGRPVAIDGRLEWREWQDQQGNKRQSVEIIADNVQFLGGGQGDSGANRNPNGTDVPVEVDDFSPTPGFGGGSTAMDDDIPFAWRPVGQRAGESSYNPFG